MKSRPYARYIGSVIAISYITLVSIKLNTSNDNIIRDKPRFFIKSTEKAYIPNSNQDHRNEGVRIQITNVTSEVLLPIPDANSPILITFLSSEKL